MRLTSYGSLDICKTWQDSSSSPPDSPDLTLSPYITLGVPPAPSTVVDMEPWQTSGQRESAGQTINKAQCRLSPCNKPKP